MCPGEASVEPVQDEAGCVLRAGRSRRDRHRTSLRDTITTARLGPADLTVIRTLLQRGIFSTRSERGAVFSIGDCPLETSTGQVRTDTTVFLAFTGARAVIGSHDSVE